MRITRHATTGQIEGALGTAQGTSTARTASASDVARARRVWAREARHIRRLGGRLEMVELRPAGVRNSYGYVAMGTYIRLSPDSIEIIRAGCNGNRNLWRAEAVVPAGATPAGHMVGRCAADDGAERVTYSW